jgi:CheY-like chemotaxis protein
MSRVLVVEDNPANQMLTCSVLQREGFETDVADSSVEALKLIDEHRPDLILMDLQLPGMDGLTFTRKLKAMPATAKVPIVAVTAHAMVGVRESALEAGCVGYISKPIDTRTLGDQVRAYLNDRAAKSA